MNGKQSRTPTDVPVSRIVGTNVAAFRKRHGLSQRGLADRIKANGHRINFSTISRIERGTNVQGGCVAVTVDHLVRLAEALEVPPALLLTAPECEVCLDSPPPGFACNTCQSTAAPS